MSNPPELVKWFRKFSDSPVWKSSVSEKLRQVATYIEQPKVPTGSLTIKEALWSVEDRKFTNSYGPLEFDPAWALLKKALENYDQTVVDAGIFHAIARGINVSHEKPQAIVSVIPAKQAEAEGHTVEDSLRLDILMLEED